MKFVYSTPAQNLAELRRRYRNASGVELAKIARWLHVNLTVPQVKNLFGLTNAQAATLQAKFAALRNNLEALETARGD